MMRVSTAAITIFIFCLLMISVVVVALEMNDFFPDERNALIQLRDTVNSTSNLQANWTGPPCNSNNQSRWAGIVCSDWHVVHLVLEGVQLTGPLPSMFLQNLTFLTKLSFANNLLQGPLPNLTNLMHLEFVLMSRNHFSGYIPFGYIELPKLTNLELQENDLSGEIPPFDQQSLIGFNVSNNKLEGPIPATGVLQRFPMSSYANNSALCGDIPGLVLSPCPNDVPTPAPAPSSRKKEQGALQSWSIALIAAAAILVPLSAIFIFLCYHGSVYRRKTKKDRDLAGEVNIEGRVRGSHWSSDDDDEEISVELEFLEKKPMFDLDDLLRAAAEEIGRGESGRTYKAMLECGSVVAVKRIKEIQVMSNKEFVQHMHLLGNISKHENLTEIISFYHSKEEKLIIYEYVADGSLYSLLHENRGINNGEARVALDWKTRVRIIKEIAKGLEYLHECLVCHGNLNSSNVLIKQQCVNEQQRIIRVKLTDYGMGGVVPAHKMWIRETPEFNSNCREGMMMMMKKKKLTSKAGDVYCFGILVLEIVTGRLPYYSNTHSTTTAAAAAAGGGGDLSGWVRAAVNNDWSTDILDMEITGVENYVDDMLKLTEIGLDCTNSSPHKRPTITQVLATLQHIV
ncbi:hypothetical protein ACP275_09G000500 [Erythranthe tilingii]